MIQRLLNTTVFRLSLAYALVFSLIAVGAMGFIYWVVERQMMQQVDARLQLETHVLLNRYRIGDADALLRAIRRRNQDSSEADKRFSFFVLRRDRNYDFASGFKADYVTPDGSQFFATQSLPQVLNYSPTDDEEAPVRTLTTLLRSGDQLLAVTDMHEERKLLSTMANSIGLAIIIIFSLALLSGALIGYDVLRRIDGVRKTAAEIMRGDLGQRMAVTRRNDEFDRLGIVVNQMLKRIEQLVQAMRDVTDNLAHDLRNPLNRLRHRLEANQLTAQNVGQFQQANEEAIQDVDDIIKTFNALLSIAQVESGTQRTDWEQFSLTGLLNDLGELYSVVAEEAGIKLDYHTEPDLRIYANRQLLAQSITNLLDNAVKYTPEGGLIELSAAELDGRVRLQVADSGLGIPEDKYEQVFERFVRLDNARSSPGNGLGLSLVKAVVDLHEADIRLVDNEPGLKVVVDFLLVGDVSD